MLTVAMCKLLWAVNRGQMPCAHLEPVRRHLNATTPRMRARSCRAPLGTPTALEFTCASLQVSDDGAYLRERSTDAAHLAG
jgi:hypothetical protein